MRFVDLIFRKIALLIALDFYGNGYMNAFRMLTKNGFLIKLGLDLVYNVIAISFYGLIRNLHSFISVLLYIKQICI